MICMEAAGMKKELYDTANLDAMPKRILCKRTMPLLDMVSRSIMNITERNEGKLPK